MKHAHPALAPAPQAALPESERSIADLMDSFDRLLGTYKTATLAGDELARDVAREALKDAHLGVLNELFAAHRSRHARSATNRAAGVDPHGPQPVGYVSPSDLERLDCDNQAFIDPPSCVAPKSIPLFAERPLTAARLADEMQDVAMTYANGWATDFHAEAARILSNQPRPAAAAARPAASAPGCPFCAGTSVATHLDEAQGTKWGFAACGECAARGPEVRTGYDCSEQAPWRAQALAEWASRAAISAPATVVERALALARQRIAEALHYPTCWDTAAYPTLESAAWEAIGCAGLRCSTCNPPRHVQD